MSAAAVVAGEGVEEPSLWAKRDGRSDRRVMRRVGDGDSMISWLAVVGGRRSEPRLELERKRIGYVVKTFQTKGPNIDFMSDYL